MAKYILLLIGIFLIIQNTVGFKKDKKGFKETMDKETKKNKNFGVQITELSPKKI